MRASTRQSIPGAVMVLTIVMVNCLSACASSPPIQFFTLEPGVNAAYPGPTSTSIVQVTRVHVPPALDRQEIVRQSGPYTVEISSRQRWSAPLDELIQSVLTADLMQLSSGPRVVLPQAPAPARARQLVVDVLTFGADPSGVIQFDASWSLLSSTVDAPLHSRYLHLSEPAASQRYNDVVAAMSRVIAQLAADIARTLAAED